ncbi:hypothetical protein AS885_06970 [Flavobacterium psychrophilum]|uniref:WYL domain-containing protein n=1 Tax=Flavobacterium psychrophilum TaxID=96345 RepID=UPI000743D4FF|nr:WYL domain-containing protein [Flavobacterium psychrophilum]KUM20591.1 hypothetical protein AS885_06970 [Flavobacterium psychrophilum]
MIQNKISRQLLIINLLLENPEGLSKSQIVIFVEKKFNLSNENFNYLDLAFKRDLKDIRNDFGIEVLFSRKSNIYTLSSFSIDDTRLELLLNSFKIFSSLLNSSGLPEYIIPEKRKASGLVHFSIITEAINQNKFLEFDYFKYDTNEINHKKIKPLALKESKNRWYLIGSYENQSDIRAFGLDRITDLYEVDQKIKSKISISEINNYYNDSFAMFTDEKVEFVKLSFDLRDGNYIKSFPIHHSQNCQLNSENNKYFITLNVRITLDFIMELLSRSWSLEVIEPLHLKEKIASIFQEALERNKLQEKI